jgi:hypothetical protein
MMEFNKAMSTVRAVSVEWMFGNITKYFSFVDFKRQMKVNLSAIGKIYIVWLHYSRMLIYVSQTFQLQPPTIDNSHYRLILKLGKEMQINHHN